MNRLPTILLIIAVLVGLVFADQTGGDGDTTESALAVGGPVGRSGAEEGSTWYCTAGFATPDGANEHLVILTNESEQPVQGSLTIFPSLLDTLGNTVPFARVCGMRITEADVEAQTLTMVMPLNGDLERGAGTKQFHGGSIAALIDTAGTFVMVMVSGGAVPTINFRTDFLRPAIDTTLTATATVRKAGRTVGVVDIDVVSDEGKLIAVGRGTFGT